MDDQLEPRVSDEDRETAPPVSARAIAEAIYVAAIAMQGAAYGKADLEKAGRAVDALISHGWGPKLTVSRADIVRRTASAGDPNIAYEHTVTELRAFGIEVTSG